MCDHELINHQDVLIILITGGAHQKIIDEYNKIKKENPNRRFIVMFFSKYSFNTELESNCKKLHKSKKEKSGGGGGGDLAGG